MLTFFPGGITLLIKIIFRNELTEKVMPWIRKEYKNWPQIRELLVMWMKRKSFIL